MQIATWNVNSLKVRLPHLLDWLKANPVDVIGIQEAKTVDEKFPEEEIVAAGYHVAFAGKDAETHHSKRESGQAPFLPHQTHLHVWVPGSSQLPASNGVRP